MPDWFKGALAILLLLGATWVAGQISSVILMVAVALLLTAALAPVVRWLDRHRVPHWASVALCFLAILGLTAIFIAYLVPLLLDQGQQAVNYVTAMASGWRAVQQTWAEWRAHYPLPSLQDVVAWLQGRIGGWVQRTIGFAGSLAILAAQAATVLVLTFFFLKDGREMLRHLLVLLPPARRSHVPQLVARIGERVGDWALGQAILMAIIGVGTGIGMWLLGVPYAILLAVIAGISEAIPYVGPVIGGLSAILVALTVSWKLALWAVGFFLLLQQLENQLLQPIVVGRAVGLHPVWVILALFVGGIFFGVLGMILAVPAAVTVRVLVEELYLPRIAAEEDVFFERNPTVGSPPDEHKAA